MKRRKFSMYISFNDKDGVPRSEWLENCVSYSISHRDSPIDIPDRGIVVWCSEETKDGVKKEATYSIANVENYRVEYKKEPVTPKADKAYVTAAGTTVMVSQGEFNRLTGASEP